MLLTLALLLSVAQAGITDEILWESSGSFYDAQIIPMGDELAIDVHLSPGLAWLLVPEGDHYRAVPRPPGFLFPTPDGPAIVQAGQTELALHALWRLGPDGFEVVRELPRERLEQATIYHAGLDDQGKVEVVLGFANGGALLREEDGAWVNGRWRGEGLDRSPDGDELRVNETDDGLKVQLGQRTRYVPLPEPAAYDPEACSETPCSVTSYRYELAPRGRYAFTGEGPVIPLVQHTDQAELLCALGYLPPAMPIDPPGDNDPRELPWNCGGEAETETRLQLVDFSGDEPRLEPVPGFEGGIRILDTHVPPEGGVQLLVLTGGSSGPRTLHLVHLDDPDPAPEQREVLLALRLSLPVLTPEAAYAAGMMPSSRTPSAGVPGWQDGAMLTGGTHGTGSLSKPWLDWDRQTLALSVEVELAGAGSECSMPSMRIGYGGHQVVLQLWDGEQSLLYGDDPKTPTTMEASGLGEHRWTLELDRVAGQLTVLRDEEPVGTFPVPVETGPVPAEVSIGTWSICYGGKRRAPVRWSAVHVE